MSTETERPTWIPFGVLGRPHGVHGEIKLRPYDTNGLLPEGAQVLRLTRAGSVLLVGNVDSVRCSSGALLVRFEGITNRDEARALTGAEVAIDEAQLPPLQPGELYLYELVNAAVRNEAGDALGTASAVHCGSQDLLTIDTTDGERLLPLTEATIVGFDRRRHVLTVRVPDGLWE